MKIFGSILLILFIFGCSTAPQEVEEILEKKTKAAEYAGVHQKTVYRHWKKHGLKMHGKRFGKKITKEQKQKILEAHKLGYFISKAAEYAGTSQMCVHKY